MIRLRCLRAHYSTNKIAGPSLISLSSSKSYKESLSANSTLAQLVEAYRSGNLRVAEDVQGNSAEINSNRSLPMTLFPKVQVFSDVMSDPKVGDWRKPMTKWFRLGKTVLKMYLNGIRDTWNVHKESRETLDKFAKHQPLVTQLYRDLEFREIESRIKSTGPVQLAITRKEFQEVHRRKEFWKLPSFFVLFILFEEALPFICYFIPSIVPWNCLTPGAFKKLSEVRISSQKFLPCKSSETPAPDYVSPYAMPLTNVTELLRSFKLLPRWKSIIYNWFDNKVEPCESLAQFHQYLVLDDWFLLQSMLSKEKQTTLTEKELINAILERQLYEPGENLNSLAREEAGRKVLLWRLFIYWAFRFQDTIVAGGSKTFSEVWGVNNVGILNFPGSQKLLNKTSLDNLEI
ncbi:LANO_0H16688g1_1 [Lachancea nothofagi CBS 11611]|uniref:LANO_0H16688g1_1 n=1 Tax=Lachancea nothofagi CBS 11611 TaxID=1266666 RepID=A0A1G4KMX9_9SACH|nr:LANO_0H16688g1_1 [Lachancea nothofagi CBS 11611]